MDLWWSLLVGSYLFGLGHGIDSGHIAAITDIASGSESRRRSFWYTMIYALGHGVAVCALGLLAVFGGRLLPSGMEVVMGRIVGVILLALGLCFLYALIKQGRQFRMRSQLMRSALWRRRIVGWLRRCPSKEIEIYHEHVHDCEAEHHHHAEGGIAAGREEGSIKTRTHTHLHSHRGAMPDDPFPLYGPAISFGVGLVQGVYVGTPFQWVLFATASGGSRRVCDLLLTAFLTGLFTSNVGTIIASSFTKLRGWRSWLVQSAAGASTCASSLVLGTVFLLGQ